MDNGEDIIGWFHNIQWHGYSLVGSQIMLSKVQGV
jgi:hypothetical protein